MGDWVVFDYGGVLCADQSAEDRAALLRLAGVRDTGAFWARYWELRGPYDRGDLDAAGYWAEVLGGRLDADVVGRLDAIDVASFSRPYAGTVRLVEALAGTTGLALLSNCPPSMAVAIDGLSWLDVIPHRFYSCRLGEIKPHPAVYRTVLDELDVDPARVTFVDDRPDNVAGAEAVGMRGVLFTDPVALAADLHLEGET